MPDLLDRGVGYLLSGRGGLVVEEGVGGVVVEEGVGRGNKFVEIHLRHESRIGHCDMRLSEMS